jgi:hypothetical protein
MPYVTSFQSHLPCFAYALLIVVGLPGPATLGDDDPIDPFAPYGTRLPPDEFFVFHGAKRAELDGLSVYYSAYRYEMAGKGGISLGISKRSGRVGEPADFDWSWTWNVPDGKLIIVSGQIYRCESATMRFKRIPDHPLSLTPMASIRSFPIPTTMGLTISDLQFNSLHVHSINLSTVGFDAEQQTLNHPGRAQLKLWLGRDHRLLTPLTSSVDNTTWVRVGQSIETTRWTLHVTRIVFPDLEQGIDGWVEVRVEASQTPKNRPPAPALPQLQVAAIPRITPEQLLEQFSPPVGHRAPPDHLQLPETRGANDRNGFPMQLSISKNESGGWSRLYIGGLDIARFEDLTWLGESEVKDGDVLSIGGQIYRWDTKELSLTRIADHPLNIPPSDAIRLFAVYPTGELSISATSDDSPYLRIELSQFDQDRKTGYAQLRLRVNKAGKKVNDQRMWVRAGQVVEIADRMLTVTRIVFPDPEQGIDGWVEFRVELGRPPTDRPPAPFLPEDFDAPHLAVDPALLCPPIGRRMPPGQFQLKTEGRSTMDQLAGYPAEVFLGWNKQGEWTTILLVNQGQTHPSEFDDFCWGWQSNVKDGHVLMIGGQIYRCDTKAMTLTRIPDHPLSLAPKDAVRLFAVYPSGDLSVSPPMFGYRVGEPAIDLGLFLLRFDPDAKTATSPGRAELKLRLGGSDEFVDPPIDEMEQNVWVRPGQVIKTAHGQLTVTRIVFPDPKQGIDGWVEIRVEPPARR